MEATQAGLVINNSTTIITPINIAFASGGALTSFVVLVSKGFVKEWFDKRAQERERKQKAGADILEFINEGFHTGFRWKAGSEKHIKFRALQIEEIDPEVGKKLRQFLNSWSLYRTYLNDHRLSINAEKEAIGFKNDAQKFGDELKEIGLRWSK